MSPTSSSVGSFGSFLNNSHEKDKGVVCTEEMKYGKFNTVLNVGTYLGGGSFGRVYTATNKKDANHEVVVKFIKVNSYGCKTEVEILKKLKDHPHIVKCLAFYQNASWIQIVIKKHGKSSMCFHDFLAKTPLLTDNLARYLFKQFAKGIQYMHSMKIAHLDIKPENSIINDDFKLKIIDFGISKDLTKTNEPQYGACGTRWYKPPEMFTCDQEYYLKPADIWSLAVTFYFAYFKTFPYEVTRDGRFIIPAVSPLKQLNRSARTAFIDLLEKMMIFNGTTRITIDNVVKHNWFKGSVTFDQNEYNIFKPKVSQKQPLNPTATHARVLKITPAGIAKPKSAKPAKQNSSPKPAKHSNQNKPYKLSVPHDDIQNGEENKADIAMEHKQRRDIMSVKDEIQHQTESLKDLSRKLDGKKEAISKQLMEIKSTRELIKMINEPVLKKSVETQTKPLPHQTIATSTEDLIVKGPIDTMIERSSYKFKDVSKDTNGVVNVSACQSQDAETSTDGIGVPPIYAADNTAPTSPAWKKFANWKVAAVGAAVLLAFKLW